MKRAVTFLQEVFHRPLWVLGGCAFFAFVMVVGQGTLIQLWNLHQSNKRLDQSLVDLDQRSTELKSELTKAKDPKYVERRARDQFNLANKGELVFVFTQ